jgi:hypothetical protein
VSRHCCFTVKSGRAANILNRKQFPCSARCAGARPGRPLPQAVVIPLPPVRSAGPNYSEGCACVWHLHHCTHRLSSKERRVHDESHHGGMAAGCRACVPHGMMMMGRVSISFLHGACESFLPSHRSAVPSPDHTTRKRTGTCFFAMLSWMRLAQRQRCAAM